MAVVRVFETQDGSSSLLSEAYGVSYHSKYGAIQESRHVFIEAGLYPLLLRTRSAAVLEMGFGSGLNAFLTLAESESRQLDIYYEAIESDPVAMEDVAALNFAQHSEMTDGAQYFLDLHTAGWNEEHRLTPRFRFKKLHTTLQDFQPTARFDLIYYDAFAPTAQPELWELDALAKMYEALLPGGIFVTYCAKGSVKRHLRDLGFRVEALPGPPGKREMTRAWKE